MEREYKMFQKVLFPTDFGRLTSHLLVCLGDLRKVGLKEVVIVNVINTDQLDHDILASFRNQHEARLREISRIKMDEQIQTLKNTNIKPKGVIKEGIVSNEIAKIAESEDVSLIIFGIQYEKRDEDRLNTLISQVIYKTKIPVLVIKLTEEEIKYPEECARFCTNLFSKVLFPTDWSECAEAALEQAERYTLRKENLKPHFS